MTNEEINAICARAEAEYEWMKDRLHDLNDENKHLNLQLDQALKDYEELLVKIDKAIEYITKQMKKYNGYDKDFENILSNTIVILGDKE